MMNFSLLNFKIFFFPLGSVWCHFGAERKWEFKPDIFFALKCSLCRVLCHNNKNIYNLYDKFFPHILVGKRNWSHWPGRHRYLHFHKGLMNIRRYLKGVGLDNHWVRRMKWLSLSTLNYAYTYKLTDTFLSFPLSGPFPLPPDDKQSTLLMN